MIPGQVAWASYSMLAGYCRSMIKEDIDYKAYQTQKAFSF